MAAIIKAQAKDRQRGGQGGVLLSPNSGKAIHTDKELAKLAGVSHDTIAKVAKLEKLHERGEMTTEERQELLNGKKSMDDLGISRIQVHRWQREARLSDPIRSGCEGLPQTLLLVTDARQRALNRVLGPRLLSTWELSRSDQLWALAGDPPPPVDNNLLPIGNIPTTERQVRPLAKLPPSATSYHFDLKLDQYVLLA